MKKTESHTTASMANAAKKNAPFFQKKGDGSFLGRGRQAASFFPGGGAARKGVVQTKLTIGEAGDVYEKEADAMADKVVGQEAPEVQKKCAHCEKEEKEALQKKPIFESKAEAQEEDMVQRKCGPCMEEEKISKKADGGSADTAAPAIEQSISSAKGKGSPLPGNTKAQMESSFGKDFSNVRIHDGSEAAAMSKSLNAQAFTHGNDIYFNSGKYAPQTQAGQHLLAHELTHTVQQGGASTLRASPQAPNWPPATEKQLFYYGHRNDIVELQGEGSFEPDSGLGKYISSVWDTGQGVPVNIRFGNLASGYIWVFPEGPGYTETEDIIPGFLNVEVAPDTEDYHAPAQVIPFRHPDLDAEGIGGTPVLLIKVDAGAIWGALGWIEGKTSEEIDPMEDVASVGTHSDDFIKLIFGEEHAGRKFTPTSRFSFFNSLSGGRLYFLMDGDLEVDHEQKLHGFFAMVDDHSSWYGALKTEIQGAEPYDLPLERTPQGYLSADTKALAINSSWTGKGFKVDGGLEVSYASGILTVTGTASYTSKRATGKVSVTLTDPDKAQELFLQHVPARKAESPAPDDFLDTALPDPKKRLALVAWGELHLTLIEKASKLEGDVAFVVSPEGYIVTAGTVRFSKRYMLMDVLEKVWKFKPLKKSIDFVVFEVPVTIGLKGQFSAGYKIGAIYFAELMASGAYSTHPDYLSEFCLAGAFDMPAHFWAALDASVKIGPGIEGYTIVAAGVTVRAKAMLDTYVRATPMIGIEKRQGESPDYCIAGKLYVGGQMRLALSGDFGFSVLEDHTDDDGNKEEEEVGKDKLGGTEWTIGDFGAEFTGSYTLGSGEKPEFSYSGAPFDMVNFMKAVAANESNKATGKKASGGFKEEGEGGKGDGKEEGKASSRALPPMHPDNEPLGTNAVTDSFSMNGQPHLLILTVRGTADAPEVKLEMQSSREEVNARIEEEMDMYRRLQDRVDLTEKQQTKVRQVLIDLEAIRAEAGRIWSQAHDLEANITPADLDQLGDMLATYARRYQRLDLGMAAGQPSQTPGVPQVPGQPQQPATPPGSQPPAAPTPSTPAQPQAGPKIPPPGVQVELKLPAQKSNYLSLYRDYIRKRLLEHSLNRPERETEQIGKWTDNISSRMAAKVKCRGLALGLFRRGESDPARDILRPYWTPRRLLGRNVRGDQMRMTVEHILEYQLRSLSGGEWVDEPWNFELLEPSANSSAGSTLRSNIETERGRLAQATGDQGWLTDDIQFTTVTGPSPDASTERYSEDDIEKGKHLNHYKQLTGEVEDSDAYDECTNRGGEPF